MTEKERKLVERLHDMITDCDGNPIDDEELVRVTPHVGVVREIADLIERLTTERATIRRDALYAVGALRGRDVPKRDAEDVGEAYDLAIDEAQAAIRALMEGSTDDDH